MTTGAASASLVELDPPERLSEDDQASLREAQFLAAALRVHSQRAAAALQGFPGVCCNCGERCAWPAVYCDAECRCDHEARARLRPGG